MERTTMVPIEFKDLQQTRESIDTNQQETQGNADIKQDKNEDLSESHFQCNICLETAKDAVLTFCGHLYW